MRSCQVTIAILLLPLSLASAGKADGQVSIQIASSSFQGTIHDNISNHARQGSGLNPLQLTSFPGRNLFQNNAVGLNFEHIFNGAKEQYGVSMFTPREDGCRLRELRPGKFELFWPAEESQWGMEARMEYDFSVKNQIDLFFECRPTKDLFSQSFVAMMWASYMNAALNRRIHFWGRSGNQEGWVTFGDGDGMNVEVGTVSHVSSLELPHEPGAQTLNLNSSSTKKFVAPFFYGLLDADQNLETKDDALLYLMLFDRTDSIRFAMWNFVSNEDGAPDTHSPAWDWQYVVRNPRLNERYHYRARVVVKPFQGVEQVADEYQRWNSEVGGRLPALPVK